MKNALVTGLNGRLAPFLKTALERQGVRVVPFDRQVVAIDDRALQSRFLLNHQIDTVFHLATGPEQWAATLAGLAAEQDLPFIFTSTESVFNPDSTGPFTPDHPADATGDYGRYKIACEQAVRSANPNATIARLGWQMFDSFAQDNLLTHVRDMHDNKGWLEASTQWLPAVNYVEHTMATLIALATKQQTGTVHIGGNDAGWSFHELVCRINRHFDLGWDIREGTDPARDGRIMDARIATGQIQDFFI